MQDTQRRYGVLWLALGASMLAASQMRFGIGLLAWLAPIPFLRYLRHAEGWRAQLAFFAASLVGWTMAIAKIVTAPVPVVAVLGFAIPIGVVLSLPHLVIPTIRRQLGERWGVVAFGALMVAGEWLLHVVLPFGTWGAAANTQLDHLALLQLASVTGVHGVSFLVYAFAAGLESWWAAPTRGRAVAFAVIVASVVVAGVFGQARLAMSSGTAQTRVAAVGTDSTVGAGPLPSTEQTASVQRGLLERSRSAARAGASLVVWTEAATMVWPADEPAFLERVGEVARAEEVTVVAGYVVPISLEPLRYRNRYAMITPEGEVDHVYDKHRPVPGEPAVRGTAPMPLYERPELGRVSGAICYDYDFPRLGLAHAELDADLVVLPSSDWRGIDPIHTQMASLRAIEGGHSLVRSTRFGSSAGFDPQGRARGWLSHWEDGDRVLVVSLPRHGVGTVYGALGDWFPLGCVVLSALLGATAFLRRSRWYAPEACPIPSSPPPAAPWPTPAKSSDWTSTTS